MAFKIIPKIKPAKIQDRSLDVKFLDKYYKQLQLQLIKLTGPENQVPYFFCDEFSDGKPLLVMGTQTAAYKNIFKAAGKGKDGFDKTKVSIGTCYVKDEDGGKVLCICPNMTLGKGKKMAVVKALTKIKRSAMKRIKDIRWMTSAEAAAGEETEEKESKGESSRDTTGNKDQQKEGQQTSTGTGEGSKEEERTDPKELNKSLGDIKKGVERLQKDVMPRYKEKAATKKDAAFVKALRKAALLFLAKLARASEKVNEKLAKQKSDLERGIPQWEELEKRIGSQKTQSQENETLKKSLQEAVNRMNEYRTNIKKLLEQVDLKSL